MKISKTKTGKQLLSLLLTAAMLVTSYQIPARAETFPANPVHHCTGKDDGTDTTDWSYVYFGSYPQTEVTGSALNPAITGASYDANGDAWVNGIKYRRTSKRDTNNSPHFGNDTYRYFRWERIKWRVLQNNGATLFVVADKGLDCKEYNEEHISITWENCTLRNWLNSFFYSTAFNKKEQGAIVEQYVVNESHPYEGTPGGNDTMDKVYLLSVSELSNSSYGFCKSYVTQSASRRLKLSAYAYARGAGISSSGASAGNCFWWLRSPGENAYQAALGDPYGYAVGVGINVNEAHLGAVVPALHINLSSDLWSLADDGSSGFGGEDTVPETGNGNELRQFESKLPKLSGNMAKQFLAFIYNDSGYEKLDLSSDKYYQLLTGDYSSVTSVEGLKQRIWAFSTFARTSMNQQVSDASYRVDYLSNELCTYLQGELKGMSEIDEQVVSEYSGKVNTLFKEEIEDILCGAIAQNVGVVITENTLDDVKLAISTYNDFANLPSEISDYVNKIVAVIEGAMYVLNNDVKGRTMYFNSYLSNRSDYSSADDEIFTTVMEYNKFVITDNTYLSNVIDFTTWITGKDSWDAHTNELNAWAECLYQLEQCMNISQHEYASTIVKPNCDERGYTQYQCTLCGKTYNNDYVDALGHDYSRKIISNDYLKSPATCTAVATYYYACSKCGARGTAVFESRTALGHRFTNYVSNNDMSCEKDGTKTAVCENGCGQSSTVTDTGSKTGHALRGINAKEATCTESGNVRYWECTICHNLYRDAEGKAQASLASLTSAALGHGSTRVVNNGDGTHSVICTRCNMTLEKENHRGGQATCSMKKKCEVCNAEYGEFDSSVHENTEVKDRKTATCGEEGYTGDTYCMDCNTKIKTGQALTATGIHAWDEGEEARTPTCMKKGEKKYTCTICHRTKTEELEKVPHTYEITVTKATTDRDGSISEKCTACGDVKSSEIIPAAGAVTLNVISYTYDGKSKQPSVTVKDSSGKIIDSQDYTVVYHNNTNVGFASVTIELKGTYTGTITRTFQILPKGTTISGKVTAMPKGFQVKWKKQKKNISGYQVQYSTSKKFKKKATVTKTVKKKSVTRLKVTKLKPGKRYYVRVRTYKTVKGVKYCSKWSKSKKVTPQQ